MVSEVNATGNQDIDGLLWGWKWDQSNLSYSFPTGTAEYGSYAAINGFQTFNAAQQDAVRSVLANVASFCNLTFTETTLAGANLRYAEATSINYTNDSTQAQFTGLHTIGTAEAAPPELAYDGNAPFTPLYAQGDSWYNPSGYNTPTFGSFQYTAGIMHETGHNLGLKHGHVTQSGHGTTFPTLPADHNSYEYSVMTYSQFPGDNTGSDNAPHHPTTFMQNDIAALQYMYGANYNYNNGDTTYIWSTTTGELFVNYFLPQGTPFANYVLMTVWDGGGNDTYDLSNYTTNLSVDLNPGAWIILDTSPARYQRANLGNDGAGGPVYFARGNIANALLYQGNTASLIENAFGGSGDDTFLGNRACNLLAGFAGNDTMNGLAGHDTLQGGSGNDLFVLNDLTVGSFNGLFFDRYDRVEEAAGAGVDTIWVSRQPSIFGGFTSSYTLGDNIENGAVLGAGAFDIAGNGLHNQLTGNDDANALGGGLGGNDVIDGRGGSDWVAGGDGNDTLIGGAGADSVDGGTEIDTASYATATSAVGVFLAAQHLNSGHAAGDTLSSIENLFGSNFGDLLSGDANANRLIGNGGADYLAGAGGADALYGGLGNDVLASGAGADAMFGGAGIDAATYELAGGGVVADLLSPGANSGEAAGDTYNSIENLLGSGFGDDLRGNNVANTITGLGGNDKLLGRDGNDILSTGDGTDRLNGGLGVDVMTGSGGNDIYFVDRAADRTVELANAGLDKVLSVVNYVLADNVEVLTLLGTGDLRGTGNSLANTIAGNAGGNLLLGLGGNDKLSGGAGNDTLIGGLGADRLTGGVEADRFDFNLITESGVTAGNRDIITDFLRGTDLIDLATIDANTGTIGNQAFLLDGGGGFTAGEIGQVAVGGNLLIKLNVDADSGAEMTFYVLGTTTPLAAGDFIL